MNMSVIAVVNALSIEVTAVFPLWDDSSEDVIDTLSDIRECLI